MRLSVLLAIAFTLIGFSAAYPFENAENVALDTAHEAHDVAAEKPQEPEVASVDLVKSTEGLPESEIEVARVDSEVDPKNEQTALPEVVIPVPVSVVQAEDPAESKVVVALIAEPESVVKEPEAAVVAIVEEPVKAEEAIAERTARAYGYPFNNYAGYGAWSNKRRSWDSYGNSYGGYNPRNYRYPGYYAPGYYYG